LNSATEENIKVSIVLDALVLVHGAHHERAAFQPEKRPLIEVFLSAIRYAARDTNLYELRRMDDGLLPPAEAVHTLICICRIEWSGNTR
jgi:hypothetical protein